MTSPIDYVARGWPVFPCHSIERGRCTCKLGLDCDNPGKHPHTQHGFKDASTDPNMINLWPGRWPNANWALPTSPDTGFTVLDIDLRHDGFRSFAELQQQRGSMPDTLRSVTGGGGRHLFYACPPGLVIPSMRGWMPGIDIRSDGGYVILPEGRHKSGMPYHWSNWGDITSTPLPVDIANMIMNRPTGSASGGVNGDLGSTADILNGVPEGQRDDVLFRLACRLRRQLGDQNRSAVEVLILHAAANCSPPFPEDEALRKVEQAFKQDHSNSGDTTHVDGFRKSHGGNSIRFARKFGHKIIYVAGPGWYAWNGSVWRRCESVDVERMAKDVVEDLYDLARHPELTGPDRTKAFTFASRTDGPHGIESMIKMARSDEGLLRWPDELDADPYKFAVKNGIVDLRTGELIDSGRFDLITSRSRYDFNPATPTPRWSAFLNWAMVGDQAMISFLQRLAGLSMIGAAPEHIMPVMLGSGRNGKNTFVETLTSILGDYAMFPFPTGALTSANMDPQATARLFGKRLAVASEANKRVPLNSAVINSYTGDGQLLAKFLYKDTFTFQTTHLLMLVANNRPKVTDTNDGIWSRLKLINWSAKIGDHEKIPRYHELMLQEEGPGIVAWCVAGAMDYLTNGLRVPPKVTEASDAYRRVEDVNGSFIEDCLVAGPSEFTTRDLLKQSYSLWCDRHDIDRRDREGIRDLINSLGERLQIDPNGRQPGTGLRGITGISVKNEWMLYG
jgi:putative DNA primase/helicase